MCLVIFISIDTKMYRKSVIKLLLCICAQQAVKDKVFEVHFKRSSIFIEQRMKQNANTRR